jgi:hypothetical protein
MRNLSGTAGNIIRLKGNFGADFFIHKNQKKEKQT